MEISHMLQTSITDPQHVGGFRGRLHHLNKIYPKLYPIQYI
jgi:hypothetical protein